MGYVLLIRHGESTANTLGLISDDLEGYPLTEKGRRQAERTARELAGIPVDHILTSPVQRCRETATVIGNAIGRKPEIDPRIRETGMGRLSNTKLEDLPEGTRETLGMESWASHVQRMRSAVEECTGTCIIVSHAFPIRSLIASYLGLDEIESHGIEIGFASISFIESSKANVMQIGSRRLSERVRRLLTAE
ncbi:MAG: histidine phosphatase family protein [Thermoplasmataceae archaeon]